MESAPLLVHRLDDTRLQEAWLVMRALWVDSGNDPDWAKVKAHAITHLYFDLFDPRVRTEYLKSIGRTVSSNGKAYGVGVYVVSNWPQVAGDGKSFAEKVSKQLSIVAPGPDVASFPKVQLDIEQHDPVFILDALERWRELRPKRDTSWTMEPMQGGWMTPAFVTGVLACKVRVVPQYYLGDMSPVAQDVALKDLLNAGFPASIVTGFYDAAALPAYWDGFSFTQGRLP